MVKNRKRRIMLIAIVFLFLLILPNYVNAAKISVGKVKGVKVKEQNTTSIKVSWNTVKNVTGYRVYVYNSTNKKYEYYGKTKSKSITIKKLKSAQEYKIKIRGYKTVKKKSYYGSYSSVLTTNTKPAQVKNLKAASQTNTTINLTWSRVTRATGYRVYIYNSSKKKYEYYGDSKTNSITIKKLKSAQQYKMKIRAYKTIKNKKYYGEYSSVLTTTTKPTQVKNVKVSSQTDSTVKLTWDKVTRASGYGIYICNNSDESYKYYGVSNTNSITIKNLNSAQIYKIKVRAYKNLNGTRYFGSYADVIETFTKPSKVTGLVELNNTLTSVKLSWNNISGATGYKIYMYNSSTKKYDYLDKTSSNAYDVLNLEPATGYKIKVRAYITYKDVQYFGNYADLLETATLPNKVTGLKSTTQTINSITIEWDKVDKVTGYAVYVYSDTSQCFKKYRTTTEATMKITDLDTARFYKIYVKSYVVVANKEYYSEASTTISQKTLSTENIKAGIDVSQHQGKIDWDQVKDEIDFAILRLGWIGNKENHTLDTQFERNYSECKRLGIPIGVYVYCYSNCVETTQSGANWAVKQLEGKTLDFPVFIDMEDSSIAGIGKDNLSNICIEFSNIIEKANFEPGIYANRNWFNNYLNSDLKTKYTCWIAHYTNNDENYEEQYSIWQYSSKGLISGISTNVDLNIIYIKEEVV